MSDGIPRGRDGHVLQPLWVWSPETIEDIQSKADLGRYTNRGLGMTKRPPHFEDLTFVPCTLSRVPLRATARRARRRSRSADATAPSRSSSPRRSPSQA